MLRPSDDWDRNSRDNFYVPQTLPNVAFVTFRHVWGGYSRHKTLSGGSQNARAGDFTSLPYNHLASGATEYGVAGDVLEGGTCSALLTLLLQHFAGIIRHLAAFYGRIGKIIGQISSQITLFCLIWGVMRGPFWSLDLIGKYFFGWCQMCVSLFLGIVYMLFSSLEALGTLLWRCLLG